MIVYRAVQICNCILLWFSNIFNIRKRKVPSRFGPVDKSVICAPLCQQVPYCTLSRLYIWNGALYNKREVLRHAAQAACPSEKQMLDSVLNGNTVFFARTSPKHTRPREGRESSCRRPPTVWMGAARTAGAFSNLDVFGSRRGGSGILPTHACE